MGFVEPIALSREMDLDGIAEKPAGQFHCADAQFLTRLHNREAAAFDKLVCDRTAEVYALLYRLTNDPEEARDLTQETFMSAFRHIDSFRGDADLKTWLYRIAINHARNRWRWWLRRRKDRMTSLDATDGIQEPLAARLAAPDGNNPEQQTLAHEREAALHKALRSLSRTYREVIILRDVEGLSYQEIATTLNIGLGTVKSKIARGRLELRNKLCGSL